GRTSGTRGIGFGWDGQGRGTGATVTGGMKQRSAHTVFDTSGRLKQSDAGAGTLNTVSDAFSHFAVSGYDGHLPSAGLGTERNNTGQFLHNFGYNAFGAVTTQKTGSLEWHQHFDEAGNLTKAQPPAKPET